MAKLSVFNFVTLNGYYKGPEQDISWHRHGPEERQYSADNLQTGGTLLFGRVTYELMAAYWPSPLAAQNDPVVAAGMEQADKIVFSRTLSKAEWQNTRVINGHLIEEIQQMKLEPGRDLTLLGSGTILTQLAEHGLIDEYQIMVDPVAIPAGTPIFNGLRHKLDLKLTGTRTFNSGVVLLCYQPLEVA